MYHGDEKLLMSKYLGKMYMIQTWKQLRSNLRAEFSSLSLTSFIMLIMLVE